MKPRITINTNQDGELELWVNEAGRDLLMRQLGQLGEHNDHFHLGPEGLSEVPLQLRPYRDGDQIIEYAKVLFRTDAWDATYFPHVIDGDAIEDEGI